LKVRISTILVIVGLIGLVFFSLKPTSQEVRKKATKKKIVKLKFPKIEVVPVIKKIPPKPTVYRGRNLKGVERWRPLVKKHFPANQVNNALLTMKLESGGNPKAKSHTSDYGLFQINAPTWRKHFGVSTEQFYDPELNVKFARVIYNRAGSSWRPWVAVRGVLH